MTAIPTVWVKCHPPRTCYQMSLHFDLALYLPSDFSRLSPLLCLSLPPPGTHTDTDIWNTSKSNSFFPLCWPVDLRRQQKWQKLTHMKPDSTFLPFKLFLDICRHWGNQRKRNIWYCLTKMEVTDDKCVPRLVPRLNIYRLHKGWGPQS